MSELVTQETPRRSGLATFFRGLRSGAFNGALMLGLFYAVSFAFSMTPPGLAQMGVTILTTSLFSGVMAVKRAFSGHEHTASRGETVTPVLVPTISQGMSPQLAVAPDVSESAAPEQSSWVARTGSPAKSSVQTILDNGSLSDKGRASALLAEREAAAGNTAAIG